MDETNYEVDVNEEAKPRKKSGKMSRMRNLAQYRDLSEEDFDKAMERKAIGLQTSEAFEKKITEKWEEFEEDYDLSDLKINDRDALRALIQAHITLEAYEQHLFKLRSEGISEQSLFAIEKFQKAMSDLRADISKIQNDLMITRKVRKSDRDASVLAYLQNLQAMAKKFYENKMSYIFCEKCNMLLATIWALYPEEDRNKIALVCNRLIETVEVDGTKTEKRCGHKTVVDTKSLYKSRGTNKPEITPESML